jgi:prefoldin subunit 5
MEDNEKIIRALMESIQNNLDSIRSMHNRITLLEEQIAMFESDRKVLGVISSFMPRAEVQNADSKTD